MSCHESTFILANSLAVIAHSMKMIKSADKHTNPFLIPVISVEKPLIALAKQIQCTLGEMCNEVINISSSLVDSILKLHPSKCLVEL